MHHYLIMEETEVDQEKVQWLRSEYEEVPQGCPIAKRVKLSHIHQQLEERYDLKYNHHQVASILQRAFPNSESKVAGKSRTKHIFGIQPVTHLQEPSTSAPSTAELLEQLATEKTKNAQLEDKVRCLEATIRELQCTSPAHLTTQINAITPNSLIVSGPESYEQFVEFTIEGMVRELQETIPDLYGFFMHLGDTSRNISSDDPGHGQSIRRVKAISALCTLLNARSNRVNGLQLLIGMMLIARSTSKQVM